MDIAVYSRDLKFYPVGTISVALLLYHVLDIVSQRFVVLVYVYVFT